MFFNDRPHAIAHLRGGPLRPQIRGTAWFFSENNDTYLVVRVDGLPRYLPGSDRKDPIGPFGFHIHSGRSCEVGDPDTPFLAALEHYNPDNHPHGNHAGDLPVLFSMDGTAIMMFYSNRFTPTEVINRTLIIHENPDDYRSQPAGDSGRRLACGEIKRI